VSEPPPNGLAVLDKPAGWTSHDAVARSRRLLGTRKVGHSGTLDPMATGVLVLGVGRSTRLLTFLSGLPKSYEATIRLGVETDSLDADGEVTAVHEMEPPSAEAISGATAALTGDLMQVPPMVSAVRVGGRRLHEIAREGREVQRSARPVTVHRFDVAPTDDPTVLRAVVECSSGTYVRVLAADLGHALGGGAHLAGLRRTSVGPFALDEACALDDLGPDALLAPSAITRVMAAARVDGATAADVGHGKVLPVDRLGPGAAADGGAPQGPWAVLGPTGDLLAVYRPHGPGSAKPVIVVAG
jgi:tRNA pseudouridine55 synthase